MQVNAISSHQNMSSFNVAKKGVTQLKQDDIKDNSLQKDSFCNSKKSNVAFTGFWRLAGGFAEFAVGSLAWTGVVVGAIASAPVAAVVGVVSLAATLDGSRNMLLGSEDQNPNPNE
ncbi:hypothetical protein KBA27_00960 [bacterium]|nr:hypothetical protein [bacterium]